MRLAKRIILHIARKYAMAVSKRDVLNECKQEERLVLASIPESARTELTQTEKVAVVSRWGWTGLPPSFREAEVFKHRNGFSPDYLTHYYYLPIVARRLNDYKWTKVFEHKGLLGYLASGALTFPHSFVRRIDKEYYDAEMRQVSVEDAVAICAGQGQSALIVKDACDSAGGKSVEKIVLPSECDRRREETIRAAFKRRPRDFVVQTCITQHASFSRFNPDSVNTLRITSLYLNGRYSTLSIILRMGRRGSTVDNWGSGGIVVGVGTDGRLKKTGFDIELNDYTASNGIAFGDVMISQVPCLLAEIEKAHKTQFPLCKLIGWDVAFDETNAPVVIEINASQPGLICEQLGTGPIFGDRTDEVIEYCKSKTFHYDRSIGAY